MCALQFSTKVNFVTTITNKKEYSKKENNKQTFCRQCLAFPSSRSSGSLRHMAAWSPRLEPPLGQTSRYEINQKNNQKIKKDSDVHAKADRSSVRVLDTTTWQTCYRLFNKVRNTVFIICNFWGVGVGGDGAAHSR